MLIAVGETWSVIKYREGLSLSGLAYARWWAANII